MIRAQLHFVYIVKSYRERVIHTQQKLEAVIRGLQPSMTYQFRVVALNERGMSGKSSEILNVTTLTEVRL